MKQAPNTPPEGIDPVLMTLLRSLLLNKLKQRQILQIVKTWARLAPQPEISHACSLVPPYLLTRLLGQEQAAAAHSKRVARETDKQAARRLADLLGLKNGQGGQV